MLLDYAFGAHLIDWFILLVFGFAFFVLAYAVRETK